jgi:hypothetical protein
LPNVANCIRAGVLGLTAAGLRRARMARDAVSRRSSVRRGALLLSPCSEVVQADNGLTWLLAGTALVLLVA